MKLSELLVLSELGISADVVADAEITLVTEESDSVVPGSIFV